MIASIFSKGKHARTHGADIFDSKASIHYSDDLPPKPLLITAVNAEGVFQSSDAVASEGFTAVREDRDPWTSVHFSNARRKRLRLIEGSTNVRRQLSIFK